MVVLGDAGLAGDAVPRAEGLDDVAGLAEPSLGLRADRAVVEGFVVAGFEGDHQAMRSVLSESRLCVEKAAGYGFDSGVRDHAGVRFC